MFRICGSFLIALVCSYYGFAAADRLRKRKDFLTAFLNSLSVLETEICFGRYDLKSVFKKINDDKLCGLYRKCAEKISEQGIKKAWEESAKATAEKAYLKLNDIDAILSVTAELGMSDIEGQKKTITRAAQLVSLCSDNANEEYLRLGRAYRGCGMLAGLFFVIMFI